MQCGVRRPRATADECSRVVRLYLCGLPARELSLTYNISMCTVYRWIKKYKMEHRFEGKLNRKLFRDLYAWNSSVILTRQIRQLINIAELSRYSGQLSQLPHHYQHQQCGNKQSGQ
ncbi:hypothetical protein OTU49_000863 [Cherax quadricarinatus]|uniref:Helix-turn-helix domain-containing protein n=1 Tax=Cherax quadricarinatus TaxID=27406 RepID=A0AAW0XY19_CHEQU